VIINSPIHSLTVSHHWHLALWLCLWRLTKTRALTLTLCLQQCEHSTM